MLTTSLTGLDRKRLRRWLVVFFLALAIPTGILVYQAYSQLKWEAFHQHRVLAEELAARIDAGIIQLINTEEARSFADYAFLTVAGDPAANFLQRSPLSAYPHASPIPGLLGYFQVDTRGAFTTPLLPPVGTGASSYGISAVELEQRLALQQQIEQILSRNRLVQDSQSGRLTGGEVAADELPADAARRDGQAGIATPSIVADKDRLQRLDDRATPAPESAAPASTPVTLSAEATATTANTSALAQEAAPSEAEAPTPTPTPALALAEGSTQVAETARVTTKAKAPLELAETQAPAQAAFDRLNKADAPREQAKKQSTASKLGRVEDLQLDYRYQSESADAVQRQVMREAPVAVKRARKERSALPEAADESGSLFSSRSSEADAPAQSRLKSEIRIRTFESEIDPFEFSLLDSGHFVLYRKVWRDGQRYIQGALIEQQPFVQGLIETLFLDTALSNMSDLLVAYRGDVVSAFSGRAAREYLSSTEDLRGTLLYQARLSAPLGDMDLILSINRLPAGPGGRVISWVAAILLMVLCSGFYLMYRLGAKQIDLTRQQQDFVSAVSHELKTPLTSIRMYGEMLREGWATDEKKAVYYDYIFDESERLSRLITNVLQLARMTRNNLSVETKAITVAELMDGVRSKVSSQIERADFELRMQCEPDAEAVTLQADPDWFTQIFINLVDNAIKFSAGAEQKVIDIGCQRLRDGSVQFSVRDYGPGVPADQMKKIFKLFYRSENELTRETVGTGIGLALVHQLARAMGGQVDVVNREPGAEFRLNIKSV